MVSFTTHTFEVWVDSVDPPNRLDRYKASPYRWTTDRHVWPSGAAKEYAKTIGTGTYRVNVRDQMDPGSVWTFVVVVVTETISVSTVRACMEVVE